MKPIITRSLHISILLLVFPLLFFTSCEDKYSGGDSGTPVTINAGQIWKPYDEFYPLVLNAGGLLMGTGVYPGSESHTYAENWTFVSTGNKVSNLSEVTEIPESGWESSSQLVPGYCYIARCNARLLPQTPAIYRYIKFYVEKNIINNGAGSVSIRYDIMSDRRFAGQVIKDPEGTITYDVKYSATIPYIGTISQKGNGMVLDSKTVKLTGEDNQRIDGAQIQTVGRVPGLLGITQVPTDGYVTSIPLEKGYGYIVKSVTKNGEVTVSESVYRLYVRGVSRDFNEKLALIQVIYTPMP